MSYLRVLPRDAFNEAKLLKCVGKLTLLIEDAMLPGWTYDYDGAPFNVCQDESDGSISVANLTFYKNADRVHVYTPMNCKRTWPACASGEDFDGDFVFDETGKFLA